MVTVRAGLSNQEGYRHGAAKAKQVLTWRAELKIPMVSLWWLSTENLAREPDEVAAVLSVIEEKMSEWLQEGLTERLGIRIRPIGKLELLPASTLEVLQHAETATRDHHGILVNVGVGYGGRQEIIDAVASYLSDSFSRGEAPEQIVQKLTPDTRDKYVYTYDCPDPDLIIRTSDEVRLSGFMLWQSVYSEFHFSDAYWPAFRKIDFLSQTRFIFQWLISARSTIRDLFCNFSFFTSHSGHPKATRWPYLSIHVTVAIGVAARSLKDWSLRDSRSGSVTGGTGANTTT